MNLTDAVREMVRRDLLRAARGLPGQRPGQRPPHEKCWVRCPISVESWTQGLGVAPPDHAVLDGVVIVKAFLQYHPGKRAWELSCWAVVDEDGEPLSELAYQPWGVAPVVWKER
jgi:hypothetical protein